MAETPRRGQDKKMAPSEKPDKAVGDKRKETRAASSDATTKEMYRRTKVTAEVMSLYRRTASDQYSNNMMKLLKNEPQCVDRIYIGSCKNLNVEVDWTLLPQGMQAEEVPSHSLNTSAK